MLHRNVWRSTSVFILVLCGIIRRFRSVLAVPSQDRCYSVQEDRQIIYREVGIRTNPDTVLGVCQKSLTSELIGKTGVCPSFFCSLRHPHCTLLHESLRTGAVDSRPETIINCPPVHRSKSVGTRRRAPLTQQSAAGLVRTLFLVGGMVHASAARFLHGITGDRCGR